MVGLLIAVMRHVGWSFEWQAGLGPTAGARDLADLEPQLCG
jgi:hypothetical protein